MDNLTQQLDDTNDRLYMVRRELKHACEQKQEPRGEKQHSASPLLSRAEFHVQELVYSFSISRTESDKSRFDRSMVETWGAELHKTTAGSHKSDPSSSPSEYSLQQQNQRNT